jgi:hypothetical protein
MNCEDLNNKLIDFCENKLSAAEMSGLQMHSASCSHCQKLVAETKTFLLELEAEKSTELNPYITEKIIAGASEKNTGRIVVPIFRLAAVLAVGIMTGILLNNFLQPANEDSNTVSKNESAIVSDDVLGNDNNILTLNE